MEVLIQAPKVQDERTKEILRELAQLASGRSARRDLGAGVTMARRKGKAAYMISVGGGAVPDPSADAAAVREGGLLKPSRSEGNTRLYTEADLERLEVILKLTRDLGVNLAGVEIILNMREKMEEMQRQIEEFVATLNRELTARMRAHGRARKATR